MNYFDVKKIENSRPAHEGTSIEGSDYRDFVVDELVRLGDEIDEWLATHQDPPEPDAWHHSESGVLNTGHCFVNDTFCLLAYDWNEGPDGPRNVNFYHFPSGCDITWYKHCGRGTYAHSDATMDMIVDKAAFSSVIDDCIASVENTAENEWRYTEEGKFGWY